jgi:hypothetical protein
MSATLFQWLDCVHQLLLQFPVSFQFNLAFLVKIAQHTYTNLFGRFTRIILQWSLFLFCISVPNAPTPSCVTLMPMYSEVAFLNLFPRLFFADSLPFTSFFLRFYIFGKAGSPFPLKEEFFFAL